MLTTEHTRLQLPRDVTSVVDNYIGPAGEIVIDSSRQELRLQDARTKGGWRFPNLRQLTKLFMSVDSEMGRLVIADDLVGIMVRTATKTWRLRKFVPGSGVNISSLDGVAGDVMFSIDERLAPVATNRVADCNLMKESGFHLVDAVAANRPAGLSAGEAAMVTVAGTSTDSSLKVLQRIWALDTDVNTVFTRRFRAASWTVWS